MKTVYLLLLLSFTSLCSAGQQTAVKNTVLTCNNWLKLVNNFDCVTIGDLGVNGNQITVEANFNPDENYAIAGIATDLVSKHTDPSVCNYLLRPQQASIRTTNGFFLTSTCEYVNHKNNHAAFVYDGVTLKFYRNGFLMSQVPASGNLVLNSLTTKIGNNSGPVNGTTKGYINEVRIWNVARTQAQIQAYMSSPLPNPTTQTGLLAYYTFDNLVNKQGNSAYNGTLTGAASINNTNPSCSFIADSCNGIVPINNIINTYTPVLALGSCDNKITVEDASTFNVGDTVLMIQMKGAVIDSINTAAFGNITNYKNAGNYEFNYVKSKTGNIIELKNVLTRQYDIPVGKVQLIRVPYYDNVTVASTLTCLPWDGNKGGVLVLNVKDTITLNADLDVSGKGFKGGNGFHGNPPVFNCNETQFYYPAGSDFGAGKAESIALISSSKNNGRGKIANGGGGGNSHNAGGGGGSNASAAGSGGYQYETSGCSLAPFDNRGLPGSSLTYSNAVNKIFLGGGGGAGHANNPELFFPNGGNGGGICIVIADVVQGNNKNILAGGDNGLACSGYGATGCHEGMGGGGGGGVIILNVNNYLSGTTAKARGGNGADMVQAGNLRVGPGGGGGGGICWLKNATLPANLTINVTPGTNGVCSGYANDPWGAGPGQLAVNLFNLSLPVDNTVFKPNIDSVRIKDSLTACKTYDFKGLGYTNTSAINTWQWDFGDAATAPSQNTSHTYALPGTYNVKLVVTDVNGCKDSIIKPIVVLQCLNPISNIINTYTPVLALSPCDNKLTVEDGSTFNIGDTVLMIQMKGAVIDSTNTAAFGTITNYKNAGNYEFNYVKSKAGNIIELKDTLLRKYDIPVGKVQLIRVPYYNSVTVTSTLTCLPWDGSKGGVLVFNVKDTVTMFAPIDVSGKGFIGGQVNNTHLNVTNCFSNNFFYPNNSVLAAPKGESIYNTSLLISSGKGNMASGGGGGLDHNSGGGGGGNGGIGGMGGYQWQGCGNSPFDNRGIGGRSIPYNNIDNKVFLGGGGGAGHCNQPLGINLNGGNGGGIIILQAGKLISSGNSIIARGAAAVECNSPDINVCNDGTGGGGAGGSIMLNVNSYVDAAKTETVGGKGANMTATNSNTDPVGPGGGGGGGITWLSQVTLPANVTTNNAGGLNGVTNLNNAWGTTVGLPGINLLNFKAPVDTILFKTNIDSVRMKDSATSCSSFDFKGLAYIHSSPIVSWNWSFGDATFANTQNTFHTYLSSGVYNVKLVATDINGCKDSIIRPVNTSVLNFDFSYSFNACSPTTVQFNAAGTTTGNPNWQIGPAIINGTLNPIYTFPSMGNYVIKYSVSNGSCTDTITKNISLSIINDDIIITPDTTICYGTTKQLRSVSSLNFCWSPATYLNDPLLANPVTSTPQPIIYYLTALTTGSNLIANGSFDNGNTGFTSQYNFANPNLTEGEYFVGNNPTAWNPGLSSCNDHTGAAGNGKMMLVNGSPALNVKVWSETIAITPNTNYAFAAWIQALFPPNPAQLRFSINGVDIGTTITASLPTCTWNQFYTTWNSGNNTTAIISIVNKNTAVLGNDFALDDISFAPLQFKRDSVKISIDTAVVKTIADVAVCENTPVQITTTGAANYSWTPATGLSNPSIGNPVATTTSSTQYIVTGTTANGCTAKDTLNIQIKPKPVITKTVDTAICVNSSVQLFASGGTGYSWTPAATLTNANTATPTATPSVNTTYYVLVTGANTCINTDSVKVSFRPVPVFTVSPVNSTCLNDQVQLNATGGNSYLWSPAALVSNPNISNPLTNITSTQSFTVTIKETVCNQSATLSTSVTVLPLPFVSAVKSNDISCSLGSATLLASGASQYTWSPVTGLSNPGIANPIANPAITTIYTVQGINAAGCINYATLTVAANFTAKANYFMPNSFTPNGDGLNDCYRIKYFGLIQDLQFFIYNRWGEKVFSTTSPDGCWDGTYKGQPVEQGSYVYYLKAITACGPVEKKGNLILVR